MVKIKIDSMLGEYKYKLLKITEDDKVLETIKLDLKIAEKLEKYFWEGYEFVK